jgi:hypothetical protein
MDPKAILGLILCFLMARLIVYIKSSDDEECLSDCLCHALFFPCTCYLRITAAKEKDHAATLTVGAKVMYTRDNNDKIPPGTVGEIIEIVPAESKLKEEQRLVRFPAGEWFICTSRLTLATEQTTISEEGYTPPVLDAEIP